jgi:hypothetical protein
MGAEFFWCTFFYKKKRLSQNLGFPPNFVQITFNQCFSWLNCAGEAGKSGYTPTRPTTTAPQHPKKPVEYDSHHSAPQIDFYLPQPPQRTPFIPLAPRATAHHRQRTMQHHTKHHSTPTTAATQHHTKAVLTAITPNALGVIVLITKKRQRLCN